MLILFIKTKEESNFVPFSVIIVISNMQGSLSILLEEMTATVKKIKEER
jgi:hypothetical protein